MKNNVIPGISVVAAVIEISSCGTRTVVIPGAATPTVTRAPGSLPALQAATAAAAAGARHARSAAVELRTGHGRSGHRWPRNSR
jgi:hypothetical protein